MVRLLAEGPWFRPIGCCLLTRSSRTLEVVSTLENDESELVVAADGSIPAEQLQHLGFRPGTHLRVGVATEEGREESVAGSLRDFPDLSWEDFVRTSELARHDAGAE